MRTEPLTVRSERWPFVVLGLVAVALAVGGWEASRAQQRAVLERRYAELTSVGQLKATEVADWRLERLNDTRMFTRGALLAELAGQLLDRPQDAAISARVTRRLGEVRDALGYFDALVATPEAKLGLTANGNHDRLDTETARLTREAAASRREAFGDFYRCTVCGRVHLDVLGPLIATSGRVTGVLILRSIQPRTCTQGLRPGRRRARLRRR